MHLTRPQREEEVSQTRPKVRPGVAFNVAFTHCPPPPRRGRGQVPDCHQRADAVRDAPPQLVREGAGALGGEERRGEGRSGVLVLAIGLCTPWRSLAPIWPCPPPIWPAPLSNPTTLLPPHTPHTPHTHTSNAAAHQVRGLLHLLPQGGRLPRPRHPGHLPVRRRWALLRMPTYWDCVCGCLRDTLWHLPVRRRMARGTAGDHWPALLRGARGCARSACRCPSCLPRTAPTAATLTGIAAPFVAPRSVHQFENRKAAALALLYFSSPQRAPV